MVDSAEPVDLRHRVVAGSPKRRLDVIDFVGELRRRTPTPGVLQKEAGFA